MDTWKEPLLAVHRRTQVDNLSNWQLCDYSVRHHAVRKPLCKSWKLHSSETNSMRCNHLQSHLRYTAHPVQLERKKTLCNQVWEQHAENRCVIAVTKHEALVFISRVQGEQIDRLAKDEAHTTKRSVIQLLLMKVLQSPNRDNLMAEPFPESDDKEYQNKSQNAKVFFSREQSNLEAHEVLMITDTLQCRSCNKYVTSGNVPNVDLFLPGASEEVKEQVLKNVRHQNVSSMYSQDAHLCVEEKHLAAAEDSHLYHKARQHYKKCIEEKQKRNILERLDRRFSPKVSPRRKSKSGTVLQKDQKRERVAMAAEREHWS